MKAPRLALMLLVLAAFVPACRESPSDHWTNDQLLEFIQRCERIELVFRPEYSKNRIDYQAETLELTDKDSIHRLVSQIALVPKEACNCEHGQAMAFWQNNTVLRVSICSHCFDIRVGERIKHYKMPETLYATFKNLAVEHDKRVDFDP